MALDRLRELHEHQFAGTPDAEISARIANYELAFRLQTSVPEVASLADEPAHVIDSYGPDARTPGTFAANCLLARRLAERGVRFIQLYHQDWDHHSNLPAGIKRECLQTDQPAAALVTDLKRRGMLDDTLVVWGGEFGRTVFCEGLMTADNFGRDHHPRCFSLWMAGGGVKPGLTFGETDDYGYNVIRDPVHIHDLHATILHLFGIDHERLTFKFQGRRYRLTDVSGNVVQPILA
jgi:arylsulfatase A-like enzyme